MKFRGHETFFIRKGWLYKGLSNVNDDPGVFLGDAGNPMDVLGIGANMVKSLRYWLVATGLTFEPAKGRKVQTITDLGQVILDNDPYMEEIGTLWLIHYNLVKNEDEATAWYIMFNEFNNMEFTVDDFYNSTRKYIRMQENANMPSNRSIDDDFMCIMRTYISRGRMESSKVDPENNIDCPLGELSLMDVINKREGLYRKTTPNINTIPPLIAYAVILNSFAGKKEIRMSALKSSKNSLGHVFNLDTVSILNILYNLEKMGLIKVIRTAGLDVIRIEKTMTYLECIEEYYKTINN